MSWRVVSTCPPFAQTGADAIRKLRAAGCALTHAAAGPLRGDALVTALAEAEAVIAALDIFDAAVLAALPKLKLISRWGVGFDAVDLAAATRQGVVVCNTPGVLDETVADLAFALLLGIARKIHTGSASMQHGEWLPEWGADVHSKTLGLVGCGRIGTAVARRARAFNMRLLACDLRPNGEALAMGVEFVPLDKLLAEADFISLHAAVTEQSRGMIGAEQLRQLKPTAYLINTARGALVDETALAQALNKGQLAGAALDAFCVEPLTRFHPLRTAQNVLLTPHIASLTHENGTRISEVAATAVLDLMAGRRPQFVVNPEALTSPSLRATLKSS